MKYCAIDLFSGCGGLSEGMKQAGFVIKAAVDINESAAATYKMNHPDTTIFNKDIRDIKVKIIKGVIGKNKVALLAGCPPCQGFSGVRRLNKRHIVRDPRNTLILDYLRFVEDLKPFTIMMENVSRLTDYYLFLELIKELKKFGYFIDYKIIDAKDYGVPQRRKRLVLVGSLLGEIRVKENTGERATVRDAIGHLDPVKKTTDPLHKIIVNHSERIMELISLIPKNGGSRKDLPEKYTLNCHMKNNVGFCDIYGRLRWDDYSGTITGGCLNPSKGRFLHPEENRVITPREATLLQSFPASYKFPKEISKTALSAMIGEALPPKLSFVQCKNIKEHLEKYGA